MGNSYQGPLETILFSFNTKELNSFMFQKKRKRKKQYIFINAHTNIYHHHLMTGRQIQKKRQAKTQKQQKSKFFLITKYI